MLTAFGERQYTTMTSRGFRESGRFVGEQANLVASLKRTQFVNSTAFLMCCSNADENADVDGERDF